MIVVYVADQNYMRYVEISAKSLLKVNPNAQIVVVGPEPVDSPFSNYVIPLEGNFKHRAHDRITSATYLKLYLTMLPFDKIICLDGDTIIQQPLNELWDMDCEYINLCESHDFCKKQAAELGVKQYGLSGMMVMNLKNLRAINYTKLCFSVEPHVSKWCHEETLLNCALKDYLKFIPIKWNYCLNREYVGRSLRQCDVAILHVCGKDKSYMFSMYAEIRPIMQFLAGKSVAIVGNAQSIFDTLNGPEIDAHDVVIRFNRGFITKPECQGSKTDIVFCATNLNVDEKLSYLSKFFVNRSRNTSCGDYTIGNNDRARLRAWLGKQPSTGFMAIDICREAGVKSIDLYGFDFEATPTFYNPADYKTMHDYDAEKACVTQMQANGILTING